MSDLYDTIKLAEINLERSNYISNMSFKEIIEKQRIYDKEHGNKELSLEDINTLIAEVRNEK